MEKIVTRIRVNYDKDELAGYTISEASNWTDNNGNLTTGGTRFRRQITIQRTNGNIIQVKDSVPDSKCLYNFSYELGRLQQVTSLNEPNRFSGQKFKLVWQQNKLTEVDAGELLYKFFWNEVGQLVESTLSDDTGSTSYKYFYKSKPGNANQFRVPMEIRGYFFPEQFQL